MEFRIHGRSKKAILLRNMQASIARQLKLDRFNKTVVVMFDKDLEQQAVTIDMGEGVYLIGIHPSLSILDVGRAFSHEMVHVKQMVSGLLKTIEGVTLWKGKPMDSSITEYLDLPWEVAAYSQQEILFRKAVAE